MAATAVAVASLALAFAGSLPGPTVSVRVPFDFRAGESGFDPGEYVISLNSETLQDGSKAGSKAGSVRLESRNRGRSVTIHARRARAAGSSPAPVVLFRVYGEQRFLASVRAGDPARAWELAPSPDERSASLRWGAPTVLSLKAEIPPPSR